MCALYRPKLSLIPVELGEQGWKLNASPVPVPQIALPFDDQMVMLSTDIDGGRHTTSATDNVLDDTLLFAMEMDCDAVSVVPPPRPQPQLQRVFASRNARLAAQNDLGQLPPSSSSS